MKASTDLADAVASPGPRPGGEPGARPTAAEATAVPKVSIGMPVYNGMGFIERATRTLLSQTFRDFELIISDNCSTDGSYEFACSLTSDPRVRVFRNETNIGAMGNFMRTLELARADYFMWAAVDDAWEPQFIERLVPELDSHPEAGVAMTATRVLRDGDKRGDTIIRFDGALDPSAMGPLKLALGFGSLVKYNVFIYGLFRRQVLEKLTFTDGGAPERIPLTELALAKSFRYVDEVLYVRQMHALKYEERNPDTAYARAVAMGFRGDLVFLRTLLVNLLTSRLVPVARKLLIPIVVGRFAAARLHLRFVRPALRNRKKPSPDRSRAHGDARKVKLGWEDGRLIRVRLDGVFKEGAGTDLDKGARLFRATRKGDSVVFTVVRADRPPNDSQT